MILSFRFIATVALTQHRTEIIALCTQEAGLSSKDASSKLKVLRDFMHAECSLGENSKQLAKLWALAKAKARVTPAHTVLPVVALNAASGALRSAPCLLLPPDVLTRALWAELTKADVAAPLAFERAALAGIGRAQRSRPLRYFVVDLRTPSAVKQLRLGVSHFVSPGKVIELARERDGGDGKLGALGALLEPILAMQSVAHIVLIGGSGGTAAASAQALAAAAAAAASTSGSIDQKIRSDSGSSTRADGDDDVSRDEEAEALQIVAATLQSWGTPHISVLRCTFDTLAAIAEQVSDFFISLSCMTEYLTFLMSLLN